MAMQFFLVCCWVKESNWKILELHPQVKTVLAEFTELVHSATGGEGAVMLGRIRSNSRAVLIMFDPEAPREMMPTDAMMKFYNCSDFPFNFNFIVDLTVLTLLDDLTGEL